MSARPSLRWWSVAGSAVLFALAGWYLVGRNGKGGRHSKEPFWPGWPGP